MAENNKKSVAYTDENIRHLSDMEHVRRFQQAGQQGNQS